jgi:hypothetical protein
MSKEEISRGLDFIEASAKKCRLFLGSRHVDAFRGSVRVSLETSVELGDRQRWRTPTLDLSREFVSDLPSQKEYQQALNNYLQSLASRLTHADPSEFLTLSGVPLDLEIHWPFRPVQDADNYFVHVLGRIGSPWAYEANFTVLIWGHDRIQMGLLSLDPPVIESFVVNGIRTAIDRNSVHFYRVGSHPSILQRIEITAQLFSRTAPDDGSVQNFLKRKVYWLGFRQDDDHNFVSINDPYDCAYLGRSSHRLKQIARILSANGKLEVDESGQSARFTDTLLMEAEAYEADVTHILLESRQPLDQFAKSEPSPSNGPRSVFISYSSEDSSFAKWLATSLRHRNIGIWLDQWEIRVGESLQERIGVALHKNDFMVVVLSPSSVNSKWVQKELAEAMNREIREKRVVVLPVIARTCRIPVFLTDKKYADFTKESDSAFEALVTAIEQNPSVPLT